LIADEFEEAAMAQQVVTGAALQCSMGAAPATFNASGAQVSATTPAGVVTDIGAANVATFGMCMSPANPTVATATSAALGVLTPQPCQPVLSPWTPGAAKVIIGDIPALDASSQTMCAWAGTVTVSSPGQSATAVE
jgi:hypothetical protein